MIEADKWKYFLMENSNPEKIKILSSFFKTGKGQYGEGDIFIGLTVPCNRKIAEQFCEENFDVIKILLHDPIHEFRLSALLALVKKYKKVKNEEDKSRIINFYLSNTRYINNWDLVDLSCPYLLGQHLINHSREILNQLSESKNMWEQRIAIVSTITLIRNGLFEPTLELCDKYINHTHDLIHKASGWMLREIGKKDKSVLKEYLVARAQQMPRTALRYAIERLSPEDRKHYLNLPRLQL